MLTLLQTERLAARSWRLEDAEAAHRIYGDPEVVRYIGGHLEQSVDTMRATLQKLIERIASLPPGMGGFPFTLKGSDEVMGLALIKPLPDAENKATDDIEIGWHLARRHWGQGYATEIGHALLRHGFETLDLAVLHAVVDVPNSASHAVARRLGMDELGLTDAYYGETLRHYRIERSTWRGRTLESPADPRPRPT